MKKKLTPKSCGHKTVPLDHFQSSKIILESVDTILYPHTNLYPTLVEVVECVQLLRRMMNPRRSDLSTILSVRMVVTCGD